MSVPVLGRNRPKQPIFARLETSASKNETFCSGERQPSDSPRLYSSLLYFSALYSSDW